MINVGENEIMKNINNDIEREINNNQWKKIILK